MCDLFHVIEHMTMWSRDIATSIRPTTARAHSTANIATISMGNTLQSQNEKPSLACSWYRTGAFPKGVYAVIRHVRSLCSFQITSPMWWYSLYKRKFRHGFSLYTVALGAICNPNDAGGMSTPEDRQQVFRYLKCISACNINMGHSTACYIRYSEKRESGFHSVWCVIQRIAAPRLRRVPLVLSSAVQLQQQLLMELCV